MINFLDLKKQHNFIRKEINKALKETLEGGVFIGGVEVEKFEKEFAKFCKVKYAVSVNSGTDALFLALKSLGIGQGDEVITTPFTFIATVEAIVNCGARPVFVDINTNDFNIDVYKIEKAITEKTKAIIPVHLFGQMADMDEIMRIARKYKLYVVEDAVQAIGAEIKFVNSQYIRKFVGLKAGSIGDVGCFSFFPSKNLGAMGDGGIITTNNKRLAEKIRLFKNHGSSEKDKYKNLLIGINSRLDAIQATVLRVKLKHLENWNKKRRSIAEIYNKNLANLKEIKTPKITNSHVFNCYTVRAKKRNELKAYMKKMSIETKIYYPICLHLQPALKNFGYRLGDFPEAEKSANQVLSLPIYPELFEAEQNFIIKKIREFYKK